MQLIVGAMLLADFEAVSFVIALIDNDILRRCYRVGGWQEARCWRRH